MSTSCSTAGRRASASSPPSSTAPARSPRSCASVASRASGSRRSSGGRCPCATRERCARRARSRRTTRRVHASSRSTRADALETLARAELASGRARRHHRRVAARTALPYAVLRARRRRATSTSTRTSSTAGCATPTPRSLDVVLAVMPDDVGVGAAVADRSATRRGHATSTAVTTRVSVHRPIGVFDSGLGGLTVMRALIDQLPERGPRLLRRHRPVPVRAEAARRGVEVLARHRRRPARARREDDRRRVQQRGGRRARGAPGSPRRSPSSA